MLKSYLVDEEEIEMRDIEDEDELQQAEHSIITPEPVEAETGWFKRITLHVDIIN